MTDIKPGQRVRVSYEAEYFDLDSQGHHRVHSWHDYSFAHRLPADATIEVLPDPVKVGNVLTTVEELDRLPNRSVIHNEYGSGELVNGKWRSNRPESLGGGNYQSSQVALPATVLYLPDGAS